MLPERSYGQRAQDDEDHRLAMCGLSFDARLEDELEDFKQRHYDFQFFASGHPQAQPLQTRSGTKGVGGETPPHRRHALGPTPLSIA